MRANLWRLLQQTAPQGFHETHAAGSIGAGSGAFLLAVMTPQFMDFC